MHIQITSRQFNASPQLQVYARKKVERLERFYDGITGVSVILGREDGRQTAENTVEMNASVHRQNLVAHATGNTPEEAVDECVDRLRRQVKRYKDKIRDKNQDRHR